LEHLARALDQAARYASARQSAQTLAAGLDFLPFPVAVVDLQGFLVFRNRAAVGILAKEDTAPLISTVAGSLRSALQTPHCFQAEFERLLPPDTGIWNIHPLQLPDGGTAAILVGNRTPPTLCEKQLDALTEREQEVA